MAESEIERVLITADEIRARVAAMAREIRAALGPGEIAAVGVLTGAFIFLADLVRELGGPLRISFLSASSYGDRASPGELVISRAGRESLAGRRVLLVEDVLDTGRSMAGLLEAVAAEGPESLSLAVFLDKRGRREIDVRPDFVGFTAPDEFLVGYGLDYAGRHRELPYVGALARSVYEGSA